MSPNICSRYSMTSTQARLVDNMKFNQKTSVSLLQFNNYTSFTYLIYISGNVRSKSYLKCSLLQCHSQHSMRINTTSTSMKGSLKVFTFHNSFRFNFPLSCRSHNFKPLYLFSLYFIVQWYKQTLKDLWKKQG